MAPTRKSRSRNPRRNVKHLVRSIHRVELGVEITPPPDPPSWTSAPWWPLTITGTAVKTAAYTPVAIHAWILKELQLSEYQKSGAAIPMRLRFVDVKIWGLVRQPITLNIPRLTNIGTRIKQLNDRGTTLNFSRLGWRYGLDSELAVDCTDTDEVFSIDGQIDSNHPVLIYLRVLYQLSSIKGASGRLVSLPDSNHETHEQMIQGFQML